MIEHENSFILWLKRKNVAVTFHWGQKYFEM